jgi:hypothetical protein
MQIERHIEHHLLQSGLSEGTAADPGATDRSVSACVGTQSSACGRAVAADRRAWLRGAFAVLAALAIGRQGAMRGIAPEDAHLEHWFGSVAPGLFEDGAAVRRFGALYLAAHPAEKDRRQLWRLLDLDPTRAVAATLIEAIARDWREHDVTLLAGWLFSRTEARICAVMHLLRGAPA